MQVVNDTEPTPACAWLSLVAGVLRLRDELLQIGGREVLACHDQDRGSRHQADRLEVLGRIVFEIGIERGRGAVRAHVPHHDRVAVGLCLRAARDAGGAAGAGDVLDDELLTERLGIILADDAGDDVRRPARGKRHDDRDRAGRIGLGACGRSRQCQRGCESRNESFHGFSCSRTAPSRAGAAARLTTNIYN